MNRMIAGCLLAALSVVPVQAKSADSLDMIVQEQGDLKPMYLKQYDSLIQKGVPPEHAARIHKYHIFEIVRGFESGLYPDEFLDRLGGDQVRYNLRAARRDNDFKKGPEYARKVLRKRLEKREHAHRNGTDYKEGIDIIDTIESRDMLYLLKRYDKFFAGKKGLRLFRQLFDGSNKECGAIILDGKRIQPFKIDNTAEEQGKDPSNNYKVPTIEGYMEMLGDVHTHPAEGGVLPGPSGYSKAYEEYEYKHEENSDLASFRYYGQDNPFRIDVMITELEKGKYNVDAYFFDSKVSEGEIISEKDATVLDLGVFTDPNLFK
ncbi:hypothetical protein GOV11_02935 [Candidatus Woesearchaeota archaeon]|nr:hypothetical protein [Candidatus Woesearchaeota archaeon]